MSAMCLSPAPLPLPGTILEKSLPCFVATFTCINFSLNVGHSGCLSTCFKRINMQVSSGGCVCGGGVRLIQFHILGNFDMNIST